MSTFWSMPARLMNMLQNPFVGMVPKTFQKSVYLHGQTFAPGLEGGLPSLVYAEFPSLDAVATNDTVIALPSDFVLLSFSGVTFTSGTPADFRVQIYDVNGQIDFIPGKAANGGVISGNQGKVLFARVPHTFRGSDPQCEVRIANLANASATIQFALYGLQGVCQQ